jgi:hypothetical protein
MDTGREMAKRFRQLGVGVAGYTKAKLISFQIAPAILAVPLMFFSGGSSGKGVSPAAFFDRAIDPETTPNPASRAFLSAQLRILQWRKRMISDRGALRYAAQSAVLDRAQEMLTAARIAGLTARPEARAGSLSAGARSADRLLDELGEP